MSSRRTGSWRLLLSALLLGFAPGCAHGLATPRTYPTPTPEELMLAVRARQAAVRGLNQEARTTSWLGGERVRGTVQMLVERGGQLRFEAEISLQGTVAALAVDHEEFTFLDHQKHVFRTGPACPSNVSTLLRIPLSPSAVAAILLGDVSLPLAAKQTSVDWAGAHGSDVLVIVGTDGSTLWVGLHRPDPARAIWDVVFVEGQPAPASARWRVSYEDLERTSGVALPRVVRFAEPGRSFDDGVEIKVRERLLNPVFPSHAFALEPPPGYAVEHAACAPPGD